MTSQAEAGDDRIFRYVIIGVGGVIAPTHIRALAQLPNAQLVGVSDIDPVRGEARAAEAGTPFFVDHRPMLEQTRPDVAILTTPHPFHARLALDCFAAGVHVLSEKPIAVEVAEADQMIAAAAKAGKILAVNFQQRFRPVIMKARELIDAGAIGPLVRTLCVEPWYRPAAYYRSAGWRGTWKGEGGAVLMNQAPHPLDLFCYLGGMPARVWGWTRTRYHQIEAEDTAQAMLEYPNGAPGYLTMSTAETGLQRRMEIVGENGALELVGDQLTLHRLKPSMVDHLRDSTEMFGRPQAESETFTLPGDGGHVAIHRDLQQAILSGGRPIADGREARMSLELANAIILSGYTDRAVRLPIDRAEYTSLLAELRAGRR